MLVVVTFDLQYYYILLSSERSVHDNWVLIDVVQNQRSVILEEKYFLTDTEYSNLNYIIISY